MVVILRQNERRQVGCDGKQGQCRLGDESTESVIVLEEAEVPRRRVVRHVVGRPADVCRDDIHVVGQPARLVRETRRCGRWQ